MAARFTMVTKSSAFLHWRCITENNRLAIKSYPNLCFDAFCAVREKIAQFLSGELTEIMTDQLKTQYK